MWQPAFGVAHECMAGSLFSHLRVRLVFLILLSVFPALGLILYGGLEQERLSAARAEEEALRIARSAAATQERFIEGARQLLLALSHVPEIRSMEPALCDGLLVRLLKEYPLYTTIGVVDKDGLIVCSAIPLNKPFTVTDRPWFWRVSKTLDFSMGDYQIGKTTHKPSLAFAHPFLDEDGRFQGAVFASLDLAWVNELVAKEELPSDTTITIMDTNGMILAHSPHGEQVIGKLMPDAPLCKIILARKGEGTAEAPGIDGKMRLHAFQPLKTVQGGKGAYVDVGIPVSVAYASGHGLLVRNVVLLGLVAVLMVMVAHVLGSVFVVRQFKSLVQTAKRLSGGDLDARTEIDHRAGEFGELAQAFDEMADSLERRLIELRSAEAELRRSQDELERRVAQRTEELATANQELHAYAEELQDLYNNAPCGYHSLDGDGVFVNINECELSWLGYSREELVGKMKLGDVLTPESRELFCTVFPKFKERGWVRDVEYQMIRKDGTIFPVLLSATAIKDEEGHFVMSRATMFDITDLVVAQRALERTAAELRRSNEELQQFAYVASHDLQEPLRMVAGYTQLLAKRYKDKLDQDANEFIAFAVDGARRMQQFINDLLQFSRVGTRGDTFEMGDLSQSVDEAIRNLELAIEEAHATVTYDALPTVSFDKGQMTQVFQNLISNAIKFKSAQPPRVHISAELRGEAWEISVRDNGIGIEPEHFDRVFVIFQRLHSREEYPGTGIGLALCKRIIERHGGQIRVESKKGEGSNFCFTIPRVSANGEIV